MPFKKDIETESGATARHWRVESFSVDFRASRLLAQVSGYTSKANFLAGKKPLMHYEKRWDGSNFPFSSNGTEPILPTIEAAFLADPFFSGASAD